MPKAFFETLIQENLKVPARVWKATVAGLLDDTSWDELGRIKTPTLILWGDHDTILSRSDQEALTAAINGSKLVVYSRSGHALYWEEPERVAAELVAFIKSLDGDAGGKKVS